MAYTKMLMLQMLLVGAALAAPQTNERQGRTLFSNQGLFSQQQQGFQQQQFPVRSSTFQQQQQQRQQEANTVTRTEGTETFKLINTLSQTPVQQVQQTRTFSAPAARPFVDTSSFQQQQQLQQQRLAPVAPTSGFAPVEFANAVAAPVQQHDAQVFTRRPVPSAPVQTIAPAPAAPTAPTAPSAVKANSDFQQFQQPAVRVQQQQQNSFQQFQQEPARFQQQTFQQDTPTSFQQEPQSFPDFTQQEVVRTAPVQPQVTRTRAQVRRPTESAARTAQPAQAPLRASPAPVAVRTNTAPVSSFATQNDFSQAGQADPQEDESFREQAQNAHYTFSSSVDDKLTDNSQVRMETRDGLNLHGLYSYSDGYFRRTVHYEADENGYRVVKEDIEPLNEDGPQPNPSGAAEVQSQISGTDIRYRITADDIKERKETREPIVVASPHQQRFQ